MKKLASLATRRFFPPWEAIDVQNSSDRYLHFPLHFTFHLALSSLHFAIFTFAHFGVRGSSSLRASQSQARA